MPQFSASAPLIVFTKKYENLRVASLPTVTKAMQETGLSADYGKIAESCAHLAPLFDRADGIDVVFSTGDTCYFDVSEHRPAIQDDGRLHPGAGPGAFRFRNLPSGEVCVVPNEGPHSRTAGEIPVSYGDEIAVFVVRGNQIIDVRGDGPAAAEKRRQFGGDRALRNIAEVAIGCNDRAAVTGNVLEDEKAGFHWAYGRSDHLGERWARRTSIRLKERSTRTSSTPRETPSSAGDWTSSSRTERGAPSFATVSSESTTQTERGRPKEAKPMEGLTRAPDAEFFYGLYDGAFKPQLVRIAVLLDVFTRLSGGPLDATDLGAATGASTEGIERLADYLVAIGLLGKSQRHYSLTSSAHTFLVRTSKAYAGDVLLGFTDPDFSERVMGSLRSGQPTALLERFDQDAWVESYRTSRIASSLDMWKAAGIAPTGHSELKILDLHAAAASRACALRGRSVRSESSAWTSPRCSPSRGIWPREWALPSASSSHPETCSVSAWAKASTTRVWPDRSPTI